MLEKATGLVTQTLVTVTKKEVISNSKTTTLTYFDKLQKKQQDQGGKYFYFSFISKLWSNNYSTISNLMWDYLVKNILVQVSSVLKILSFWKKFYALLCIFCDSKKICNQAHNNNFKFCKITFR